MWASTLAGNRHPSVTALPGTEGRQIATRGVVTPTNEIFPMLSASSNGCFGRDPPGRPGTGLR
ncbi:MAG: hypothetical protein FWD58_00775 [Firmicutes bacterium]|nr:hypothetical protein [Bacillota bacterium]